MKMDSDLKKVLQRYGYVFRSDNTLHGWTKARMVLHVRDLEHNWAVALERIEHQYQLLLEKCSFSWHDLRNNAEDIPKFAGTYLCYIENGEYRYYMTCSYHLNGLWIPDDETASDNVVKWKEIEP